MIGEYKIENENGTASYLSWEKEITVRILKKGKLKTKLLKITLLGEQEHSVQPADKAVQAWRWGYLFTKTVESGHQRQHHISYNIDYIYNIDYMYIWK